MPAFSINEGYTIRKHPSGAWIYMSKQNPGSYINANGQLVDAKKAREAGFDVDKMAREASKRRAMEEARKRIEKEYSESTGDLERVIEASGYGDVTVRKITGGKYALFDKHSRRLTERGMTKTEADMLLATASGGDPAAQDAEAPEPTLDS